MAVPTPSSRNRLQGSLSPYLLHHADNPVPWQPWDAAALAEAGARDVPIFLSVGYAACHWCHVMERESFCSAPVAELLAAHFVCIKVDREERPDLDAIYMAATTALNHGRGGWPMSVFLTPQLEPFFAGTYYPPQDRAGSPGFLRLVSTLARLWREDRTRLSESAASLTAALQTQLAPSPPATRPPPTAALLAGATQDLEQQFDAQYGGFGAAPKFPQPPQLALLLHQGMVEGGDGGVAHAMLRTTLHGMAGGGIYDHLGGGFARYSTDAQWLVPHFEKMLYDNAGLAQIYAQAAVALQQPQWGQVARHTCDFVLRELRDAGGAFYCALDADSEGEEGKFYVWRSSEIDRLLAAMPEARHVMAQVYDLAPEGNWEGTTVLARRHDAAQAANSTALDADQAAQLAAAHAVLLEARGHRPRPATDDKVLTAWTGMMVAALAQCGRLLDCSAYLEAAQAAVTFVLNTMRTSSGGLLRTYRQGQAHGTGFLEDYAYFCEGLLELYEAVGTPSLLHTADSLMQKALSQFYHPDTGIFYATPRGAEHVLLRMHSGYDGAMQNAHATAARNLARLALHLELERDSWRQTATQAVAAYGDAMQRAPAAHATFVLTADFVKGPHTRIHVHGDADDPRTEKLWAAVRQQVGPRQVIIPPGAGKTDLSQKPCVVICRGEVCSAPLHAPEQVHKALRA